MIYNYSMHIFIKARLLLFYMVPVDFDASQAIDEKKR